MDFFRRLDLPVAEQVIEVPKISCSPCPSRSLVPEPQTAEQLLEVPTVLSPTRIALRIAEQIVDTPVPRGRDRRRLQGSLPRQSSTAAGVQNVNIPVRGGLRGFLPGQSSAQCTVEQLFDSSSGGLQDYHLGQGSTASSSGREDEAFSGGSRTFPGPKKCEGTCSLQVGTGRALELIHAGRLWRGEFARGAGPGGEEGEAPGLAHAGLHRVDGAQRRQCRTYFWNRRSQATVWKTPPGVQVV